MNNNINVSYEKVYTDDVGKTLVNFNNSNVNLKSMWEGAIDAFYQNEFTNKFICLHGDIRVIIAIDEGNNNYKFNQYFLSGLDGKILTIMPETWYGVHNLGQTKCVILNQIPNIRQPTEKRLSSKIFNWHAKR